MVERGSTVAVAAATAAVLMLTLGPVRAAEDGKYPNWKGQWSRFIVPGIRGQGAFDQTKPWGLGQQAPLTAEYQKESWSRAWPTRPPADWAITPPPGVFPAACRA
jgi:hypothetical protein